jgi:phosphopentomutase
MTGRKAICNLPYSGTDVIRDYGKEHVETGALIVYTSADSVFQIAAHEDIVPVEELYRYCEMARKLLAGEHGVGRVIARPFNGTYPDYKRTTRRHDFSLIPPMSMMNQMKDTGLDVLAVGKIFDIFAGEGITDTVRTQSNAEGIERLIERTQRDFEGLCFVNLVDFDMLYGHRNDVDGYAKALTYFDEQLPKILEGLRADDIFLVTADHGCDPSTPSTDHSREYIPLVVYGDKVKKGLNLGTRKSFADIAATILEYFKVEQKVAGTSFLTEILK